MRKIAIIGAGISGLSTAFTIERLAGEAGLDVEVTVFEREERTGGKIWSIKEEGYLCEWGPNGFLDSKPMTLELCDQLGIQDQLERSNDNARKRFIYSGGILNRLPENGPMFLQSKLISWPGKIRLAQEFIKPKRTDGVDETLAAFARRRLGAEALDKLIGKQVASAAGPGGVLTSFVGGIQELTDGTVKGLKGEVRTGQAVAGLKKIDGGWELRLADGSNYDADVVVSAAPAHVLKELTWSVDGELSELLDAIPYAPMNVICFGYEQEKVARDLDGFGYLIPKKEGCNILGTLWDSSIFPQRAPEGHVMLRSMMGGATTPEAIDLSDAEVKPQYVVGHAERLLAIDERLKNYPGLILTGNSFFGIGLNDCVNAAYKAGDQVISCLQVTD
jgi:oxygen-dependent protoporphyrinogen oxidase